MRTRTRLDLGAGHIKLHSFHGKRIHRETRASAIIVMDDISTCEANRLQTVTLTPIDDCAKPYTPSIHDNERNALVVKFNKAIVDSNPVRIVISEYCMKRCDYRVHVTAPFCRELNTLGWFTRIERIQHITRDVYVDYEYNLVISDVPM